MTHIYLEMRTEAGGVLDEVKLAEAENLDDAYGTDVQQQVADWLIKSPQTPLRIGDILEVKVSDDDF